MKFPNFSIIIAGLFLFIGTENVLAKCDVKDAYEWTHSVDFTKSASQKKLVQKMNGNNTLDWGCDCGGTHEAGHDIYERSYGTKNFYGANRIACPFPQSAVCEDTSGAWDNWSGCDQGEWIAHGYSTKYPTSKIKTWPTENGWAWECETNYTYNQALNICECVGKDAKEQYIGGKFICDNKCPDANSRWTGSACVKQCTDSPATGSTEVFDSDCWRYACPAGQGFYKGQKSTCVQCDAKKIDVLTGECDECHTFNADTKKFSTALDGKVINGECRKADDVFAIPMSVMKACGLCPDSLFKQCCKSHSDKDYADKADDAAATAKCYNEDY